MFYYFVLRFRFGLWCLTSLSTISQLYLGSRLYWWRKPRTVAGENHRPVASHGQTLSHNVVSSTPRLSGIQTHNVSGDSTDCIGSCKSN